MRSLVPAIAVACSVLLSPTASSAGTITGTAEVVDGDGLIVAAVPIRLHGIDAPEAGQDCTAASGGTWPCGEIAAARLAELAEGREVVCEGLETDAYNRVVARCQIGDVDLARAMAEEGLAWAFVQYSQDYVASEEVARAAELGVWQEPTQTPSEYRDDRWGRAVSAAPGGCPIKGNVNREGERIYHTPWSRWYARTQINTGNGERWFCDEAEAQAAGWRAAQSR